MMRAPQVLMRTLMVLERTMLHLVHLMPLPLPLLLPLLLLLRMRRRIPLIRTPRRYLSVPSLLVLLLLIPKIRRELNGRVVESLLLLVVVR